MKSVVVLKGDLLDRVRTKNGARDDVSMLLCSLDILEVLTIVYSITVAIRSILS